jgi:YaiO family outer membrane protein
MSARRVRWLAWALAACLPARAHAQGGAAHDGLGAAPSTQSPAAVDAVAKARSLQQWGDRAGALRLLSKRVELEPSDAGAKTAYGGMLAEDGHFDQARAELVSALRLDPKQSDALRRLLEVELATHRPERACELATEALKLESDRAEILFLRARAYFELLLLDEARADVRRVLALAPRHPGALELEQRAASAVAARARGAEGLQKVLQGSGRARAAALFDALLAGLRLLELLRTARSSENPAAKSNLLDNARALHARGERERARQLLEWHLEATPTDSDARTLYGTFLSWDGQYDEARRQLGLVLHDIPGHSDATRASLHAELWADHPEQAENLATQALERDKDSTDLLLDRARARLAQNDLTGSLADVDRVLQLEPNNADAGKLRARVESVGRVWTIGGSYTYDTFSDHRTPWHEATVQAKRKTPMGAVILRVYEAWRFDSQSQQVELEAFPRIRDGTYADVAVAVSPDAELYPKYRLQADLYQSLPFGLEASIGYRHLQFGSGVDMGVITLGKYLGDWYFTLRSFITPGVEGTSVSLSGSVRRYWLDGAAYVGVRYGHGLSKEELRSTQDILLLSSNTLAGEMSIVVDDRWELGLKGSVSAEGRTELSDLWQYEVGTSLGFRF